MNYSEPLISQITVFFRAVGCGIILGVLYCAVGMLRMLFGERKSVYIFFDTLFFLIASMVSFFFMVLYNSGQIRFNLMLAELSGGIAFHFSFGKYVLMRYKRHLYRIRKIFEIPIKAAKRAGRFLLRKLSVLRKILPKREDIEIFSKKFSDIGKILLKNKNKSV